jgi:hypothetical protein
MCQCSPTLSHQSPSLLMVVMTQQEVLRTMMTLTHLMMGLAQALKVCIPCPGKR